MINASRLQLATVHIEVCVAGWLDFAKYTGIGVNNIDKISICSI